MPVPAVAGDGVERLLARVAAVSGRPLPSLAQVREHCVDDTVCAARVLVRALGPGARLEAVRHPTSDEIRGVATPPSVAGSRFGGGVLKVGLERFGRNAVAELRAVLEDAFRNSPAVHTVVLDLCANGGGDFDRMLRVAGLFTGSVPGAVRLIDSGDATAVSIPGTASLLQGRSLRVRVGPRTASSAEVLAALLRVHAGARISGSPTRGKDYLVRVVPVRHDWRLLVPAERIEVPGTVLAGGIVPDTAE